MADIITNAKTVLVRLTSAAQDGRSITLDNPRENITLAQIKQGFQSLLDMRLLLGNKGDNLDAIESATVTTTQKIKLGDSDIEISVTPNEIVLSNATETSETAVVEGSNVIGAYVTNIVSTAQNITMYATVSGQNVTVLARFPQGGSSGTTATLNIVTEARTVSIPIRMAT